MSIWSVDGEFFDVGRRVAPAGVLLARNAVRARLVGDFRRVLFYAQ
jgi:hypothetical protein